MFKSFKSSWLSFFLVHINQSKLGGIVSLMNISEDINSLYEFIVSLSAEKCVPNFERIVNVGTFNVYYY